MVPRLTLVLASALVLSACATSFNPVRDVLVATGSGAEPKPAPDFVTATRPAETDFQPVGVAPPARSTKAKTTADVQKAEAEMDALKAANEARAATARQAGSIVVPAAPNAKP